MPEDENPTVVSSDSRGVRSNSKHETSTKRRRIKAFFGPRPDYPLKPGQVIKFDCGPPARYDPLPPRSPPRYDFDGICAKKDFLSCVEMALSSYNEANRVKGPEYELVSQLGCILQTIPFIYHFNFIARPKNAGEGDQSKLFFAEVSYDPLKNDGKGGLGCRCCCILGPPGTETGLGGCRLLCEDHPGLVQHPEDGFSKKRPWDRS